MGDANCAGNDESDEDELLLRAAALLDDGLDRCATALTMLWRTWWKRDTSLALTVSWMTGVAARLLVSTQEGREGEGGRARVL